MSAEAFNILLVEDDPNDVLLVQRAFRKGNLSAAVHVASDGQQAEDYLAGRDGYSDRAQHPLPALVLLDLKLPRKSGHEVLAWLRAQPVLKRMPVVVLTSSRESPDITRAYELGANSYLIKPVIFDDLVELMKRLNFYWRLTNQPPPLH